MATDPVAATDETPAPVLSCAVAATPATAFPAGLSGTRLNALIETDAKWANHTRLRYFFYDDPETDGANAQMPDGSMQFLTWVGPEHQKDLVRKAFNEWKALGIGLEFEEIDDRNEAEIRIGFMRDNTSWSHLGTGILQFGPGERTMNFGWNLRTDGNVALHEIGHTLGMPHEHQNPFSGIVWNEEAVIATYAGEPNKWNREKTTFNILRKLDAAEVIGSAWDPDSIMHYPIVAGLIAAPVEFARGVQPRGGLSAADAFWARKFYPPAPVEGLRALGLAQSARLGLASGEQADFVFEAPSTRRFTIQALGVADVQIVVFEELEGKWAFTAEDDDSGTDRNARLSLRLRKGGRYAVRVRMRFNGTTTEPAIVIS